MKFTRIILSTVCLALFVCYQKICFLKIDQIELPFNPDWEIPSSVLPLLSQPFSYLAEGTQAHVFISQDQKTVLKIFKNTKDIEQTIDAYRLAYDFPNLTEVLFIHLNPKRLSKFTIVDQWGRFHQVDPAETRFVLQRRAKPFFKTLRNATQQERAHLIQSFHSLLEAFKKRGIANLDNSLGRNFGFIDGRAVAIDFGRFVFAPELVEAREAHLLRRLDKWVQKSF